MTPTPVQASQTIAQSVESLKKRTATHNHSWGLADSAWQIDLDTGIITFSAPSGLTALAPLQIIGTLDDSRGHWRWGWAHSSVRPGLALDATIARQFGAEHGLEQYTTPHLYVSEAQAWEFTAVAFHLAKAQGAHLGYFGPMKVFMTFGMLHFRAAH